MDFKKTIILVSIAFTFSMLLLSCGNDTPAVEQEVINTAKEMATDIKATPKADTDVEKVADAKTDAEAMTDESTSKENVEDSKSSKKEEKKPKKVKPKKRAKMHFPEKVHDYGFIMQGDTVRHDFYFKNVGNDDLVITRVKASCGCTTPLYPREPIPPGEEGKISVMFKSAGKLGRQVPSIDVYTNYKRKFTLELKGFVDAERAKTPKVNIVEEEESTSSN